MNINYNALYKQCEYKMGRKHWKQPSREVEQKHNITGISQQYNLPTDEYELETIVSYRNFGEDDKIIKSIYKELLDNNKCLREAFKNLPHYANFKRRTKPIKNKYRQIILGCTSRFHIECIKHFIYNEPFGIDREELKITMKYDLYWKTSPTILEKVLKEKKGNLS